MDCAECGEWFACERCGEPFDTEPNGVTAHECHACGHETEECVGCGASLYN